MARLHAVSDVRGIDAEPEGPPPEGVFQGAPAVPGHPRSTAVRQRSVPPAGGPWWADPVLTAVTVPRNVNPT